MIKKMEILQSKVLGLVLLVVCLLVITSLSKFIHSEERKCTEPSIIFNFCIPNLLTNHQYEGRHNTFYITYKCAKKLQCPGFYPPGKKVDQKCYPYVQTMRSDLINYIHNYPDKTTFYEIFAADIAKYIVDNYPQVEEVEIKIVILADHTLDINREVIATYSRKN